MIPSRAQRPDRQTLDRGADVWRGARLCSINGATAMIKVLRIGSDLIGTRTIATSLLPIDARSTGQPLCVKLDPADVNTVIEVRGSTWPAGDAPANEAAAAAGEGTHCGIVPRSLTRESRFYGSDD